MGEWMRPRLAVLALALLGAAAFLLSLTAADADGRRLTVVAAAAFAGSGLAWLIQYTRSEL